MRRPGLAHPGWAASARTEWRPPPGFLKPLARLPGWSAAIRSDQSQQMAFPTAVNSQITDVTQTNVKVLAEAPAMAAGL